MKALRISFLAGLSIAMLVAGIFLGATLEKYFLYGGGGIDSATGLRLVDEAWSITRTMYVDREATEPTRLAYGAIEGMLTSLGDTGHSAFLTPEDVRYRKDHASGQYEGIGIEVRYVPGRVEVVGVLDGSPAMAAGLKPGDQVIAIDGQPIVTPADARRVLGPAGTSVILTVISGEETREVALARARLAIETVSWAILPGSQIAHLRIAAFSKGTADKLNSAIDKIGPAATKGIVLDLRGNSGGLYDEVVGATSEFIGTGNVMLRKSAEGTIKAIPVKPDTTSAATTPLVVLVDRATASGAEVMAAALQDSGRATLVGETTAGTGTILRQFTLTDGSALLLGFELWLTPSGRSLWHQGLTPDITATLPEGVVSLKPVSEKKMTPEEISASGDSQLLTAMKLLAG
ncbi:MAG: S41 family peptidase [Chloroflexota bacterium]